MIDYTSKTVTKKVSDDMYITTLKVYKKVFKNNNSYNNRRVAATPSLTIVFTDLKSILF